LPIEGGERLPLDASADVPLKVIGAATANVYLARCSTNSRLVAVKQIDLDRGQCRAEVSIEEVLESPWLPKGPAPALGTRLLRSLSESSKQMRRDKASPVILGQSRRVLVRPKIGSMVLGLSHSCTVRPTLGAATSGESSVRYGLAEDRANGVGD
jgi:hypothetical protein